MPAGVAAPSPGAIHADALCALLPSVVYDGAIVRGSMSHTSRDARLENETRQSLTDLLVLALGVESQQPVTRLSLLVPNSGFELNSFHFAGDENGLAVGPS